MTLTYIGLVMGILTIVGSLLVLLIMVMTVVEVFKTKKEETKMSNSVIKFKHLRNKHWDLDDEYVTSNLGGVSFSFREKENGDYEVGMAVCSGKDNFCFAKGREISTERLLKNPAVLTKGEMNLIFDAEDVFDLWLNEATTALDAQFKTRIELAMS